MPWFNAESIVDAFQLARWVCAKTSHVIWKPFNLSKDIRIAPRAVCSQPVLDLRLSFEPKIMQAKPRPYFAQVSALKTPPGCSSHCCVFTLGTDIHTEDQQSATDTIAKIMHCQSAELRLEAFFDVKLARPFDLHLLPLQRAGNNVADSPASSRRLPKDQQIPEAYKLENS